MFLRKHDFGDRAAVDSKRLEELRPRTHRLGVLDDHPHQPRTGAIGNLNPVSIIACPGKCRKVVEGTQRRTETPIQGEGRETLGTQFPVLEEKHGQGSWERSTGLAQEAGLRRI